MSNSTPSQLRFAPSAGFSIRADFAGGGLSSDLGPMLLRSLDRQIGLTERLASAITDRRHPGYVQHPMRDLLTQRIFQIASGYEDGNDSQTLRHDPMFRLGAGRTPFDPEDALASGATISRLEHAASTRLKLTMIYSNMRARPTFNYHPPLFPGAPNPTRFYQPLVLPVV